jgi:hypothetical protein
MQKILQRLFIAATALLVIWIWYSVQAFVPAAPILYNITYHGKFAQWTELPMPQHWQASAGQFFPMFFWPFIGLSIFLNWKTGKMFDFK